MLMAMFLGAGEARAMDDKEIEQLGLEAVAVAHGDYDCSGVDSEATLWRNKDGLLVVEIALEVPEKLQAAEFGPYGGATVTFGEPDVQGCQALLLADDAGRRDEVWGLDNKDVLVKAQAGAGDGITDAHVVARMGLSGPNQGPLIVAGLDIDVCDLEAAIEGHFCWSDGCSNACGAYGVVSTYRCEIGGNWGWCNDYGCVAWKQECTSDGWTWR